MPRTRSRAGTHARVTDLASGCPVSWLVATADPRRRSASPSTRADGVLEVALGSGRRLEDGGGLGAGGDDVGPPVGDEQHQGQQQYRCLSPSHRYLRPAVADQGLYEDGFQNDAD